MEKTKQFLREHKMLVAASSAVILIAIIIVLMVLMSKPETPVSTEDSVTNVSTELTDSSSKADENYLNDINKAPENTEDSTTTVDKDSANEFTDGSESTVEDSDKDTSTSNTDESTEEKDNNEGTENKDKNENNNSESTEVKEPEGNTSSESSTTVTPPVEEETVTPPPVANTVPSVSWTGSGVTLGSLGITIPTLSHFNTEALTDNTNNTHWYGNTNDTATGQVLADTLNSVASAVISTGAIGENAQTFAVEQYSISWDWASYSSTHDFQLYRNPLDGTYTLTINDSLLPETVNHLGVQIGNYNNDILLTLCSICSSQPQVLKDYIFGCLWGSDVIYTDRYVSVGDCKLKIDPVFTDTHQVFYIKAN